MSPIRGMLMRVFTVLPALILSTVMNVFITSIVSISIFLDLCDRHSRHVSLVAAIIIAVVVYLWIVYNHKLKLSVKQQGIVDE